MNLSIKPLTTYTLTIAVGNPTSTAIYGDPSADEFIQFLANGSALNSALFPDADVNVSTTTNGTFTDYTATFTTGAVDVGNIFNDALAIQMGGSDQGNSTGIGAFDNVRLDVTAVPEPSTWALVLLGAGAVVFVAARGRNLRA